MPYGIFGLFRELLSKDTGLKYIETLLKYILSGSEFNPTGVVDNR